MTAPHFHTVDEAKAAISRIEHNASGPGSPAGKKAGPPMMGGGSGSNDTAGCMENKGPKGKDWIGGSGGQG